MTLEHCVRYFPEYVLCACGNKVSAMIVHDKIIGHVLINLPNGKGVYELPMVWNKFTGRPENIEDNPTNHYYRLVIKSKHKRKY